MFVDLRPSIMNPDGSMMLLIGHNQERTNE